MRAMTLKWPCYEAYLFDRFLLRLSRIKRSQVISLAKFGHTAPDLGPYLFFLLKILCIYLSENSDMKIEIVSNFTFLHLWLCVWFDKVWIMLTEDFVCSALLCFANYWCLWAWVFVCVSLRLCFVFVWAKKLFRDSESCCIALACFFVCWRCCCFGCFAWKDISDWWKFICAAPEVEMEQCD